MTIEWILVSILTFSLIVSTFVSSARNSFNQGAPRLGARIEMQIKTGDGFRTEHRQKIPWEYRGR